MSLTNNSQREERVYARIYYPKSERDEIIEFARNSKYKTFNRFARTAIALLKNNPDLPDILDEIQGKTSEENVGEILRYLVRIDEQVSELLRDEQRKQENDQEVEDTDDSKPTIWDEEA